MAMDRNGFETNIDEMRNHVVLLFESYELKQILKSKYISLFSEICDETIPRIFVYNVLHFYFLQ